MKLQHAERVDPGVVALLCDPILTKRVVVFGAVMTLSITSFVAQELPNANDAFEVEPPLLVLPGEAEPGLDQSAKELRELPADVEKLEKQLESAKKSAASAERLVKIGVLAKAEGEQRALRVVRLEAELANAQVAAAKEQVALQKSRLDAGEISKGDLEASAVSLAQAIAAAQTANAIYQKAQLDAAALNLSRQKLLFALGSARKSDVARAEEKLAALRRGEQMP
jgi:hypothetical protein